VIILTRPLPVTQNYVSCRQVSDEIEDKQGFIVFVQGGMPSRPKEEVCPEAR